MLKPMDIHRPMMATARSENHSVGNPGRSVDSNHSECGVDDSVVVVVDDPPDHGDRRRHRDVWQEEAGAVEHREPESGAVEQRREDDGDGNPEEQDAGVDEGVDDCAIHVTVGEQA